MDCCDWERIKSILLSHFLHLESVAKSSQVSFRPEGEIYFDDFKDFSLEDSFEMTILSSYYIFVPNLIRNLNEEPETSSG